MKYKLLLSLILLSAIACGKANDNEGPDKPKPVDYLGTVSVEFAGSWFDNEDITVSLLPTAYKDTVSIFIHKIKFVPMMQVTVDVTIPGVALQEGEANTILSCEDVAPLSQGGEYPDRMVTEFTGEIKSDTLSFSLKFGGAPTRFTGIKQ